MLRKTYGYESHGARQETIPSSIGHGNCVPKLRIHKRTSQLKAYGMTSSHAGLQCTLFFLALLDSKEKQVSPPMNFRAILKISEFNSNTAVLKHTGPFVNEKDTTVLYEESLTLYAHPKNR